MTRFLVTFLLGLAIACAPRVQATVDRAHLALVQGGDQLMPYLEAQPRDATLATLAGAFVVAALAVTAAQSAMLDGDEQRAARELAEACEQVPTFRASRTVPGVAVVLEGLAPICSRVYP